MAIEKMHFMSIVGLLHELDDFVLSSIVPFDIQLVDAYETLDSLKGIQKFSEENKYEKLIVRIKELAKVSGTQFEYDALKARKAATIEEMSARIKELEDSVKNLTEKQNALREEKEQQQGFPQAVEKRALQDVEDADAVDGADDHGGRLGGGQVLRPSENHKTGFQTASEG